MASNAEKSVKEWILQAKKAGKSDEEIRKEMLKKGYVPSLVDKMLLEAPKGREKRWLWILLTVLLIAALAVAIGLYFPQISSFLSGMTLKACLTDECFISSANECSAARMEKILAGSLYQLSEKGCILEKKLSKMNETEPKEMKDLLESKAMTCIYEKGMFDENLVKTISLGIENCEGELKDAIEELTTAV